jgi:hypothetical protein
MSVIELQGERMFSPVYDPTPMRAYKIHDMLSPMPFGNYGEYATNDEDMVGFEEAISRLLKKYSISKPRGRLIVEESLEVTKDYLQRVDALENVNDDSKRILQDAVLFARKKLQKFLLVPSSS